MSQYKVIVDIKIAHEFEAENENDAISQMENIELPNGYVEDSFELDKVIPL